MKKVLTVLLAAVMVFALAACGGGEDSSGGSGKVAPSTSVMSTMEALPKA